MNNNEKEWMSWLEDEKTCKKRLQSFIKSKQLYKEEDNSDIHLEKAEHNLRITDFISSNHKELIPEIFGDETFWDWVIIPSYYAIYRASLALICKEGYGSKSHAATLCFLIYHHYHKKSALDKEDVMLLALYLDKNDITIIGESKNQREEASYGVGEIFEKTIAENTREQAISFVNKIREIIS